MTARRNPGPGHRPRQLVALAWLPPWCETILVEQEPTAVIIVRQLEANRRGPRSARASRPRRSRSARVSRPRRSADRKSCLVSDLVLIVSGVRLGSWFAAHNAVGLAGESP